MSDVLRYSMFYDILFPKIEGQDGSFDGSQQQQADLRLQRFVRFKPDGNSPLTDLPLVIFDFETTGLDAIEDRIIEVGAQKIVGGKVVDEFSSLIKVDFPLPDVVLKITGITDQMLADQPPISAILPDFLDFIDGSVLAAHNAEFDMGFLTAEAARLGLQLQLPCFCTLKMARVLLPALDSKNLDTLAKHYNLTFEARHRSIGDVKVTNAVLTAMLAGEGVNLKAWRDFEPFIVSRKDG